MHDEKILVVEDDKDIQELIKYNLQRENYAAVPVSRGDEALEAVRKQEFGLILLDLMLPGIDGLKLCGIFKSDPHTKDIPIIMVTAKGEESDIVRGLELGADDYIVKPFSPKVLMARIRTVLRRSSTEPGDNEQIIRSGQFQIHPGKREVLIAGKFVELTYTEFEILHHLASHPGWVFTRFQIVDAVKGEEYPVTDRSVDVQIAGLRKKLGRYGNLIETIRGVGYRFADSKSED